MPPDAPICNGHVIKLTLAAPSR